MTAPKIYLNKFLLLGDSITEFSYNLSYPNVTPSSEHLSFVLGAALQNDYVRKLDMVQRGFAGYNSRVLRRLLPDLLKADHDDMPEDRKIKIASVFLGTNDAAVGSFVSIPLEEYEENMEYIIKELTSRGIKVIVSTPTYHEESLCAELIRLFPQAGRRTTERNLEYGAALKKIAVKYGAAVCDLYEAFTERAKELGISPIGLLSDGIHFNGLGYEAWYIALTKAIKENYPELSADALPQNVFQIMDPNTDQEALLKFFS